MTWIKNNLFFWRQTRLIPVRITISDALHKKSKVMYYKVERYSHRKHLGVCGTFFHQLEL